VEAIGSLSSGAGDTAAAGSEPRRELARDWYARWIACERESPGELRARAPEVLALGVARTQQCTLLRALHDVDAEQAWPWFEHAVRHLPIDDSPHAVSTPTFALGFLYEHAERDLRARESLARLAADREQVPAALRARAAARVAQLAEPAELRQLRFELRRETDPAVVNAALAALESRTQQWDALCILREHGRDIAAHE
jgi:hypothetical protein